MPATQRASYLFEMILVGKVYHYPVGITNSFQQDLSFFFLSLYRTFLFIKKASPKCVYRRKAAKEALLLSELNSLTYGLRLQYNSFLQVLQPLLVRVFCDLLY